MIEFDRDINLYYIKRLSPNISSRRRRFMEFRIVDVMKPIDTLVNFCAGIKPGENALIIAETNSDMLLIRSLAAAINAAGGIPTITIMGTPDPPRVTKPIGEAAKGSDVVFLATHTRVVHDHTLRYAQLEYGTRFIHMVDKAEDLLKPSINIDYDVLYRVTMKLADEISKSDKFELTCDRGSHLTASVKGREVGREVGVARDPASFSRFPAGEIYLTPVEGTGEGTILFDLFSRFGRLKEPVKFTLSKGWVTEIEGGDEADTLRKLFESVENMKFFAEIGMGTNDAARVTDDKFLREEISMAGTVHIGFGDSTGYGGRVRCKIHRDGFILKPTVKLDGKTVVEKGQLKI